MEMSTPMPHAVPRNPDLPVSAGASPGPILEPGRNCWRIEACDRASVLVDAAEYYHLAGEAMQSARQRILIIGWEFDTRIRLEPGRAGGGQTLGEFILALARAMPARRISILKWGFGALKQLLRPSALWMLWRWHCTRAIAFRFDRAHPPGCSHHQKILVVDDCLAVCGGIDMSTARWDTSEHLDDDPRRIGPEGRPYPPWHDVTMMLAGPVAAALGELGAERWQWATSEPLDPLPDCSEVLWPDDLSVQFENVRVGIARTRSVYEGCAEIREIEALYLDMVAAAQDVIYIENQYFTSARVAVAIAARLKEPHPPEVVMVMPRKADGWLEQVAMDAARIRLARKIAEADPGNRFRIYVPVTAGRQDIYVHAKVMIVDHRLLRIGSSNLNNRSLGLDSECDVVIDAALPGNQHVAPTIAQLRTRLLSEHLGVEPAVFEAEFARSSSLTATIEALRCDGRSLDLLDLTRPGPLDKFVADNELLDPESADGFFEPMGRRGLRRRWREGLQRLRRLRPSVRS